MFLHGFLGATDYKVNEAGIPVQLVGDTYLPQGGITTVSTGKGWYEVWQNGVYVGHLKPGGKNGVFVASGAPVVWPSPPAAPPPVSTKSPDVIPAPQSQKVPITTSTPPPPIQTRNESIPQTSSSTLSPSLTPSASNMLFEVPGTALPIEDTASNTSAEVVAPASPMPTWLLWSVIAGGALLVVKGGRRGRR